MATTSEARALPFFTDLFGLPLESGSIYIGQSGLDPVAYPAVVTSDIAGSVVVTQPIRTTHGHAVSAGAQIHLYCQVPYSITILDAAGRVVYASLNETDPVALAVASSSVQSAADLATLRARSGSSTNQVWVTGFGLYVYIPTDKTSPENIPRIIVGNDGSRYYLDTQYVQGVWVSANSPGSPSIQGAHLSWNDAGGLGQAFLTSNKGLGVGGVVLRTVNIDGSAELGRVTVGSNGSLSSDGGITTLSGDIRSAGNLIAQGSIVSLLADGSRSLAWDPINSRYVLAGSVPLFVNGSTAVTVTSGISNQLANGVGALALGTNAAPTPAQPGTWAQTGTNSNSVYLWVRTA
jgi:hypothetical protein